MSQQVPQPYSDLLVAGLTIKIVPYAQSMEGGLNAFIATIPANATQQIYKQSNPYRKTLTLINNDSTNDLSMVILNKQNVEVDIPLKHNGGGYNFVAVKRGSIQQCINGLTLEQDLVSCEYQGVIIIKNATGSNVDLLIIEAV